MHTPLFLFLLLLLRLLIRSNGALDLSTTRFSHSRCGNDDFLNEPILLCTVSKISLSLRQSPGFVIIFKPPELCLQVYCRKPCKMIPLELQQNYTLIWLISFPVVTIISASRVHSIRGQNHLIKQLQYSK